MKNMADVYGQQLFAQYEDNSTPEIVERDDGLITVGHVGQFYLSDYKDWSFREKKAMRFVHGKRVLDIGCGAGRHSLYLQKKGFDVLGIDNSPLALKVSKLKGLKKTKRLSIEDIEQLKGEEFTTILMLGNNFGLFGNLKKAKRLLRKLQLITSADASILAETRNPYKTVDPIHLEYHDRNRSKGRMAGQLKIRIRFKNLTGPWFDYLLVSPEEMKAIVDGTGWRIERLIGKDELQYIAVLKKERDSKSLGLLS